MHLTIGIASAAGWDSRRLPSLKSLRRQLPGAKVLVSERPESAQIWARRLWRVMLQCQGDVFVFLNDDVEVCEDFENVVRAMWQGEPLSLHTSAPDQVTKWAKCYWMTGPAYVLSREMTEDLYRFSENNWSENEDNVGIRWAWVNQRPFYSPIPSPVRHLAEVPSTLGYDDHPYRTTRHFQRIVPTDPEYWKLPAKVPLVTNPWWRP